MPILMLLPFGVFFICCILQFWYLKQVRDALIDRHSETYLSVEKSSIFPLHGLWKFARGSRYKQLNDADLNRHVRNLKRLMIVGYASWATYGVCIFTMAFSEPRLATAIANGTYENGCCGKIILKDGQMTMLKQQVSYVVESDKEGPYVLPANYIGASSRGFVIRRKGFSLKLHLDNDTRPATIELMDDTESSVFSFRRVSGSYTNDREA